MWFFVGLEAYGLGVWWSQGTQWSLDCCLGSPLISWLAMATYTCNTCRALLDDAEAQRAHYKTDWHRYNLRRKVAGMAPVGAEGFQERVRAQRALAEPESKGAATYCSVCSKKFASFKAYENHLRSRRHVELEKQAVSRQVAILNEKNLEKGLGVDSVDKDAVNAAIQQVIKAQPSTSPKEAALAPEAESRSPVTVAAGGRGTQQRDPAEKPPRLQWFEQQAKKLAERHGEEESEEDLDADGGGLSGGRGGGRGWSSSVQFIFEFGGGRCPFSGEGGA